MLKAVYSEESFNDCDLDCKAADGGQYSELKCLRMREKK